MIGAPVIEEPIMSRLSLYFRSEAGASMVEYALIIALVAIVVIGGLAALQAAINGVLHSTGSDVNCLNCS
jgi:Flp pilus assembly pilin Flp